MNYLISLCALLLINSMGCQSSEQTTKKGPESSAVENIRRLATTPKSILDLVRVDNKVWVLKSPKDRTLVESYTKKMLENARFFNIMNSFNFVSQTGSVLNTNEFKGLLIEYLPSPEWSELHEIALSQSQLETILGQLLASMEKLNNLTLSSCVLHQKNLLINKHMQIKYIDRDDIDCQIGLSKASNEKNDLIALKTIISDRDFVKNNSIHKQYLEKVKQVIEASSSAAMVLKVLKLNFPSNHINDLSTDAKNKLTPLIETIRKRLNETTKDNIQGSHLDSVIEVLLNNGITHFDKAALEQFYKELITLAHDNSAEAQDDFSYALGHGEVQSGYTYYTNPPEPDELVIRQKWLNAFKTMPLEWAR